MPLFTVVFVLLCWICLPVSASLSAPNKVVITYASLNERTVGALLVALDQGFFNRQNLDVKLVNVHSGPVALEETAEGYEVMRTLYERRIYPNVTGIRNIIRLLAPTNEKIARLRAEDVVDDRPSLFSTETRPYFSRRSTQSLRRSLNELIHGGKMFRKEHQDPRPDPQPVFFTLNQSS